MCGGGTADGVGVDDFGWYMCGGGTADGVDVHFDNFRLSGGGSGGIESSDRLASESSVDALKFESSLSDTFAGELGGVKYCFRCAP